MTALASEHRPTNDQRKPAAPPRDATATLDEQQREAFLARFGEGDPVGVCRRVRAALTDAGRVMLVEPTAAVTLAGNRSPLGRSFLAASTMICLPSALSQGGDRHLGAQAPDAAFAEVAAAAGFSGCERVTETPLHRVLQLTP